MLAALGLYLGEGLLCYNRTGDLGALEPLSPFAGNAEPTEFRVLNDRLLARAGATWNRIEPFLECRDEARFRAAGTRLLQRATFGSLRRRFLRPLPACLPGPWGWKDPRNSLTLPYWLRLFPTARVIHVRREPAAVVESLHRRAAGWHQSPLPRPPLRECLLAAWDNPAAALRYAGRRLGIKTGSGRPDPCLDRDYCAALTAAYVEQCLRFRDQGSAWLEVHHEALLADPVAVARALARFAGAADDERRIEWATALVRPPG
jgi:hypothetical protein